MKLRMLLLLAACLLFGCVKQGTESTPQPSAASIETPAPTEMPTQEIEEPPAEDVIPIDPTLYTYEDCCYTLLEHEDCTIEVFFTRDSYGAAKVLLYARNHTNHRLSVGVDDILLNGIVQAGGNIIFEVPANGAYCYGFLSETELACALLGYENLESMTVTFELRDGNTAARPFTCTAEFSDGVRLHNAYTVFREMRADRQVLRDDEKVTIALLGCGDFFDGMLTGYVWVQNHGDEEIPTMVSGLSLNGVTVPIYSIAQTLAPGAGCVMRFSTSERNLDTAGVQSIGSLRLQILSSEEENSSARGADGGRWYPAALARSGRLQTAEDGRLLYDDGLLRLSLQGMEIKYNATGTPTAVYYYVKAENLRSEGIRLSLQDVYVGDKPYVNAWSGTSHLSVENNRLGPESMGVMIICPTLSAEDMASGVPELSFRVQVQSQGGDSIFYTIDERIVLTEEQEEP